MPAEKDVAGGLHEPLPLNYPLAMVVVGARSHESLEHRRLGLFALQYESVILVAPTKSATQARVPTLPTPTTLRARSTYR